MCISSAVKYGHSLFVFFFFLSIITWKNRSACITIIIIINTHGVLWIYEKWSSPFSFTTHKVSFERWMLRYFHFDDLLLIWFQNNFFAGCTTRHTHRTCFFLDLGPTKNVYAHVIFITIKIIFLFLKGRRVLKEYMHSLCSSVCIFHSVAKTDFVFIILKELLLVET